MALAGVRALLRLRKSAQQRPEPDAATSSSYPDVRLPVLKALGVDVSAKPELAAPGQERRFIH